MAHSFVRSPPCNNGVPIFFNISFAAVSLSIVPILKEDNCSIVLPMISQLSSDDCRISMCYRITCLLWCVSPFLFFSPVIVVLHSMRRFDLLFGHVSSSAHTRPREKREGENGECQKGPTAITTVDGTRFSRRPSRKTDAFQSMRNMRSDSSGPTMAISRPSKLLPLLMRTKPSSTKMMKKKNSCIQMYTH